MSCSCAARVCGFAQRNASARKRCCAGVIRYLPVLISIARILWLPNAPHWQPIEPNNDPPATRCLFAANRIIFAESAWALGAFGVGCQPRGDRSDWPLRGRAYQAEQSATFEAKLARIARAKPTQRGR